MPFIVFSSACLAGAPRLVILAAQLANQRARARKGQHIRRGFFASQRRAQLADAHHLLLISRLLTFRLGLLTGQRLRWCRERRRSRLGWRARRRLARSGAGRAISRTTA